MSQPEQVRIRIAGSGMNGSAYTVTDMDTGKVLPVLSCSVRLNWREIVTATLEVVVESLDVEADGAVTYVPLEVMGR